MSAIHSTPRKDVHLLTTRILPLLRTLIQTGYFSLKVEGAEHIPRRGAAVFVANHAGWFTLDSLVGALVVADHAGVDRLPFGAVHDELLKVPLLGRFFEKVGGFPASWLRHPRGFPPEMEAFLVYPEGTEGNCKPFWQAYRMRDWQTGFVRLAATRRAVIVPVAIIGGEECLPVLSTLRSLEPLVGSILPVPFGVMPLPSRWQVVFHPPIQVEDLSGLRREHGSKAVENRCQAIASTVRGIVQGTLDRETSHRPLARLARFVAGRASPVVGPAIPWGTPQVNGGREHPAASARERASREDWTQPPSLC